MTSREFVRELQALIENKHLLRHPFYQQWSAGTLPVSVLKKYAEQYLHLEKNFPRLLSTVHAPCEDFSLRQVMSDTLHDEEHGNENHRELWLRFGESVGNDRDTMMAAEPLPETTRTMNGLLEVCRKSTLEGISVLAAYESQMPEVAASKLHGLKMYYGITDQRSTAFFRVHHVMDDEHRKSWWNAIEQYVNTSEQREAARSAVIAARDALWSFLDGICRAYLPDRPALAKTGKRMYPL